MKKIMFFMICCCFFTACSEAEHSEVASYPIECKDAFTKWDSLLDKMKKSDKFSSEAILYFEENTNFIIGNISKEPDPDVQKKACEPISRLMQLQLEKIENIQNMSQEEIDYEFGVTRIPLDKR